MQNESSLNWFMLTAPELMQIVNEFQNSYSVSSTSGPSEHYQLSRGMAKNARKIKDCLEQHCEGNPFISVLLSVLELVNITPMMALLDNTKDDILKRDEKGQSCYKGFVTNRLSANPPMSLKGPDGGTETKNI